MNDSSTSQETGTTVADAADRIASLLGPADSETDETQEDQTSDAEDDEEEGSQAQSDDDQGDESDEQDETDEASEQPELYTVKVAGEEVQVTLEEALKGYSREQDYTRKTQAHAEQARQEMAALAEARDSYGAKLATLDQVLSDAQPKVDQSLRDTNPAEWAAQMLQHRQWAEQKQALEAERARIDQEASKEEQQRLAETVKTESAKLLEVIPEWADPKVAQAESQQLRTTGLQHYGFTTEELDGLVDHRMVRVLRDAVRYRELQGRSAPVKAKVDAVKAAKPGTASAPPSKAQELTRAKQRLRQSGRVDDAAAAIERML